MGPITLRKVDSGERLPVQPNALDLTAQAVQHLIGLEMNPQIQPSSGHNLDR